MSKSERYFFIFALAAIVCLFGSPSFSLISAQTATKSVCLKTANRKSSSKSAALRHAKKKKVKIKEEMNRTNATILSAGAWGATGIALTVTDAGALIEYDCASGEVTEKLTVDADGNFTANGTHTLHSAGPTVLGSEPKTEPARYEGKISGETMTLKVILAESGTIVGEYALRKGVTPRLHRCY